MDYVAVGFDVAGNVKAFTTGTFETCKAAAKRYRRREKGFRVYPVVKIMPVGEWEAAGDDFESVAFAAAEKLGVNIL